MVSIPGITAEVSRDRLAVARLEHLHLRFVGVDDDAGKHPLVDQSFQRPQSLGRPTQQPAEQCPRQPSFQRTQQQFLLPIDRQVVQELPGHQRSQDARPEGAFLHGLRRPLGGLHLRAVVAVGTTVGVPHLFDHVYLCLFHLRPLRDVGVDDDPLGPTATARQFLRRQRILGPPVFPELRELDPRSSWLSLGPRQRRVRIGVWLSGLLFGIQSLDGFGHEEQRLVGRGSVPLAALAEHRPLEESQLLSGLRQLLLVCGSHLLLLGDDRRLMCDGLLLLGDDGLLIRSCLLQITNPLLAGRQLIGKRWTSFFHAQ